MLNLDQQVINEQASKDLLRYTPTVHEREQLCKCDFQQLTLPEQYLYIASTSPLFSERLHAIQFMHLKPDLLVEARQALAVVNEAVDQIMRVKHEFVVLFACALYLIKVMDASKLSVNGAIRVEDLLHLK